MSDEIQANEPISILLVADEVLVRNFLNAVLTCEGYVVFAAANSEEAFELIHAFPDRMQLMAACLAGNCGMDLARRMSEVRTIVVSASTRARLEKMIAPPALLEGIRRALADAEFAGPRVV